MGLITQKCFSNVSCLSKLLCEGVNPMGSPNEAGRIRAFCCDLSTAASACPIGSRISDANQVSLSHKANRQF